MDMKLSAIGLFTFAGVAAAQCGSENVAYKASGCDAAEPAVAIVAASYTTDHHVAGDIVDTAIAAGNFETLVAAVKAANLVSTLKGDGPFTVFAPTDAAFNALPDGTVATLLKPENRGTLQSILTYHVVKGEVLAKDVVNLRNATTVNGQRIDIRVRNGNVFIDGAQVVTTDIRTDNGVIHVIDRVIMPETKNIAGVAEEAGSFGTLLKAAEAAGLVPALTGKGPLTVFAPTDEAFEALGYGTVRDLLKPENKSKLANILKYHVVSGRVYAKDAVEAGSAETLEGGNVMIDISEGRVTVNDASIVSTDIEASNGVIHVIDAVLLPH